MSTNTHDSNNIYFNIQINSDNTQSTTYPQYNVQRTRNIVDKASDYYLSVVRFTIPSFYVPVLIFELLRDGGGVPIPGVGVYSITLERLGQIEQRHILYTYQGNGSPSISKADHYYIYSFVHMATMINTAFTSAYNALSAGVGVPAGSVAPYFVFNPNSRLFTLFADETYSLTSENTVVNPITIYMNDQLWTLFYALPHLRLNQTIGFADDGKDVQLLLQNYHNNWSDSNDPNDDHQYLVLQQEYITLYNWNPYKKIVLITSLLPSQSEYVKGNGDGFEKILTDFSASNDIADQRSVYQYLPTAQYRLIDLLSDDPVRRVDVRVFWQDIENNLIPIALPWNSQINIKMAFINRKLYDQNIGADQLQKFNVRMIDRVEKTHTEQIKIDQRSDSKKLWGGRY